MDGRAIPGVKPDDSQNGCGGSGVDHPSIRIQHALVHRLGQGRVREDRVDQLFLRRLEVHGDDETLDELRHLGTDEMGAEELAGLLVEDRLHQALVLAERDGGMIAVTLMSSDLGKLYAALAQAIDKRR